MNPQVFQVAAAQQQQTLAALLRQWLPGQSWSQVRRLVDGRRVRINGEVWLDSARRLKEGDKVEVLAHSAPVPRLVDSIVIRHIDTHLVVVEKPAGVSTVRHPSEREWSEERRQLVPTLDDLVAAQLGVSNRSGKSRLRIVHRLDKETSGLLVFARTVDAERGLGLLFRRHKVTRRYLAIVSGKVAAQTIRTSLVRDRGDGRRGSTTLPGVGKDAITHLAVEEELPGHTLLSVRLETGRTHQIRIHLAELGHPVCGERVYSRAASDAPRLALHATELGFAHPITNEELRWEMPLPPELREFVAKLRNV